MSVKRTVSRKSKRSKDKQLPQVDFSNTEVAFKYKSDIELRKASMLFSMMNSKLLVDVGSWMGITALKMRLPLVPAAIKATIYSQFVGGTTLLNCQPAINKLFKHKIQTILDYGAEAKSTEKDFNHTMNETIRAIEFANTNESVPVVSTKVSGLARFGLLESIQKGEPLTKETKREYRNILKRIDAICHIAHEREVGVFFDAEESWIQDTIDHLVNLMMKRYNKEQVIVYNTFQMYRHDRLKYLIDSFNKAERNGYLLGAKIVRGAYMEKERERAVENGYLSPIQPDKAAADDAYNTAIRFCIDNYKKIASCNATHNAESCMLQAKLIDEKGIPRDHPHLNFCQLYGMSDHLTFNLANAGYNTAKYMPYGDVKEVFPYLIRRAQENTSVLGDASRECRLIATEIERRKLEA